MITAKLKSLPKKQFEIKLPQSADVHSREIGELFDVMNAQSDQMLE